MYEEEDPKFYNFQCEKPFLGNRHYERKGLAYCETHYHQVQTNYHQVQKNYHQFRLYFKS